MCEIYAPKSYNRLNSIFNNNIPNFDVKNFINIHRYDGNILDDQIKFMETNCDLPGGHGKIDAACQFIQSLPFYQDVLNDLPNNIEIKPILSLKNLISQIKKICKQKNLNKPNLAIIGYNDYPNRTANMQALRSRIAYKYSNLFNNIYLLFPNELFYKNNVLNCKEGKIDIIHRYHSINEIFKEKDKFKVLIKAMQDKNLIQIAPPQGTIISNKGVFSLITDPENKIGFTQKQKEYIKKHIPWTRKLNINQTTCPENKEINIQEYCLKNQQKLVIKPTTGMGGEGVVLGWKLSKNNWKKELGNGIKNKSIVQIKVDIQKSNDIYDLNLTKSKKFIDANPLICQGKLSALHCRASDEPITNVAQGAALIPVFLIKNKKQI